MLTRVCFQTAHGSYQGGEVAGLPDGEAAALAAAGIVTVLGHVETAPSPWEPEKADDLFCRLGAEHHFRTNLRGADQPS